MPTTDPWAGALAAPPIIADDANGGPRREPELSTHEDIAPPPPDPAEEFELADDRDDDGPAGPQDFQRQARNTARQVSLDRDDDMGM